MALPYSRRWMTLTLIAIILPISLLTTLKITGIISGPPAIAETIPLEAKTFRLGRPDTTLTFVNKSVKISYIDNNDSVEFEAILGSYVENHPDDGDCLHFNAHLTANLTQGFVHSVHLNISQLSDADVNVIDGFYKSTNLNVEHLVDPATPQKNGYIIAKGISQPESCKLKLKLYWLFYDTEQNNKDHRVTLTATTIIYNGSVYKQTIMPIELDVTVDPGETFESLRYLVWDGNYSESLNENDNLDVYGIPFRRDGATIAINLAVPQDADFNLYFYDSDKVMVANSTQSVGINEIIVYKDETMKDSGLNYSPWSYIIVERLTGNGTYRLEINRG